MRTLSPRTRQARLIAVELRRHAPFTLLGALTGIVIMWLSRHLSADMSYRMFYILHPLHVLLSALVTASMFQLHRAGPERRKGGGFGRRLLVGYVGSVGVATLSDS